MEGAVIWMLIAIAAGVIDALTSNFFFVIFSVGAVAASIMSALHIPFGYQIIVFAWTENLPQNRRNQAQHCTDKGKNLFHSKSSADTAQLRYDLVIRLICVV